MSWHDYLTAKIAENELMPPLYDPAMLTPGREEDRVYTTVYQWRQEWRKTHCEGQK